MSCVWILLTVLLGVAVCDDLPEEGEILCDPPVLEYGVVNVHNSVKCVSIAVFSCNSGYELSGQNIATCTGSNKWYPDIPKCIAKSCGDSGFMRHGRLSTYSVGSMVRFTCDEGYEIKGRSDRTCLASQEWSGNVPTCVRVTCPPLDSIKNGKINYEDRTYEGRAIISCETGYKLKGPKEKICQADKTWSGEANKCVEILCDPPVLQFGSVKVDEPVKYSSIAVFSCNSGYGLHGEVTSTCTGTNKWYPDIPKCIISCDLLPNLDNGKVDVEGIRFGDKAYYSCDDGFRLSDGSSVRTCGLYTPGKWSGWKPSCIEKNPCQVPQNKGLLEVKYFDTSNNRVDADANKELPNGYSMLSRCDRFVNRRFSGSSKRICNKGNWTGTEPSCATTFIHGEVPGVSYRGRGIMRDDEGHLVVKKGNRLILTCESLKLWMLWKVTRGDLPSSVKLREHSVPWPHTHNPLRKIYYHKLVIKDADSSHANTYLCSTHSSYDHAGKFIVKVID